MNPKRIVLIFWITLFGHAVMAQQNVSFRQTALVSPQVNEGSTVTFKLRAPLAKTVTVRGDWEANGGVGQMNKENDGTWSYTTPDLLGEQKRIVEIGRSHSVN